MSSSDLQKLWSLQNLYFQSFFGIKNQPNLSDFLFCKEYLTSRSTFISEIFWKLWFLKYFVYQKFAQFLSALFISLVGLMMTLFSEKMRIFHRCIHGLIPNLIKKSWTVSILDCDSAVSVESRENFNDRLISSAVSLHFASASSSRNSNVGNF